MTVTRKTSTIPVTLPADLESDFLEWLNDTGHLNFRKWLRENTEMNEERHVHFDCDFTFAKVVITEEESD